MVLIIEHSNRVTVLNSREDSVKKSMHVQVSLPVAESTSFEGMTLGLVSSHPVSQSDWKLAHRSFVTLNFVNLQVCNELPIVPTLTRKE